MKFSLTMAVTISPPQYWPFLFYRHVWH